MFGLRVVNRFRSGMNLCASNMKCPSEVQTTWIPSAFLVRNYSESEDAKPKKKSGARKGTTPAGKFDDHSETAAEEREPQGEKEPLERFPNNKNPLTGEIGGPRGPEPTRYGDWERKGRVTDF